VRLTQSLSPHTSLFTLGYMRTARMVAYLKQPMIEEIIELDKTQKTIIILDQITDPQNIGAILRSATAFSIDAMICLNNKSNIIESAIIAKVACGALENTPIVTVTNLSRTIDLLKKHNFWVIGLDGEKNNSDITNCNFTNNIAVIIGSEDKGLRRLTKEKCDIIARIDINNINSLNAAQAATIACYEMQRQRKNNTN
ncbi:MAG: RNA methyltransferase, partial [Pseudomonadota bacterium]